MTTYDFSGRTAVVTGAASGIGRGITMLALEKGMRVVAADLSKDALENLADAAENHVSRLEIATVDVADEPAMQYFSQRVFRDYGSVNLLFNNAGILRAGRSWEMSLDDWRQSIEVNVLGVVLGLRCFVPPMLEQGAPGRILNTASIGALLSGGPFMGAYQGSKHMVAALTESLHRELRAISAPLEVSLICPAAVSTAISDWHPEHTPDTVAKNDDEAHFREAMANEVSRGISPEEFASTVFDGIVKNRFWIIPESVSASRIRKRTERILGDR